MKHYVAQDERTFNSEQRKVIANTLPVFSFQGPIETGLSGYWSPPHDIRIVNGWMQARTTGFGTAALVILRAAGFVENDVLAVVNLSANAIRATFTMSAKITPYDKLYIASFAESGHEDISVQMYGERV